MKFQLMQSVATSTQKLSNRSSDVILVKTAFVGERSVVGLIQSLDRDTLTNEPTAVKMNTTKPSTTKHNKEVWHDTVGTQRGS